MKKNDRYNYVHVPRSDDEGNRTYDVQGARLPSVTTILSRTKDQGFIRRWKAKVGEAQAEVIKNIASKRGTSMHKFIEAFILGRGYEDLTSLGQQAKTMAAKVIEKGLTPIEEYYGSIEQVIIMVCTPDLYLQEFRFQGVELRAWKHKFLKRLDEYYEIIKEPTVNEKELLKEFEEDKT
jgi:hypothetical protein